MITDITVAGVSDFLKGSGRPELSSVTFFERDFGGDLSYPACIVTEAGDPEENEVIRGQYTVPISVVVMTIPEADESATTHRQITQAVTDLVGDAAALKDFLGTVMQVNDSTGGQGMTEPVDGYRQTTFALEIKCAEISDPAIVPYLIEPKDLRPLLLYYGTQGITTEGGSVEKWTQAAGKSNQLVRDLVQTTAEEQPMHDASGGFLQFDAVDKQLDFSATAVEQAGVLVVATSNGIFAYEVDADSVATISALGAKTSYFQGLGLYAYVLLPTTVSHPEVDSMIRWLEANTGATKDPAGSLFEYWRDRNDLVTPISGGLDYSGVTNLHSAFRAASSLTSFPALNLSGVTDLTYTFRDCNALSSIDANLDVSGTTKFYQTFEGATALTSFPLLDTSSGTTFYYCWYGCTGLKSFPALDMSSGTNFYNAWYNCSALEAFPAVDMSSGTNFGQAWRSCTAMTTFGDCTFSSDPSVDIDFTDTWRLAGITDFPALNLSRGTSFLRCWENNDALETFGAVTFSTTATDDINFQEAFTLWDNVASFPALNLSRGTNFTYAWRGNKMTSFGVCTFSTTATDDLNFTEAWKDSNQMTTFPAVNLARGTSFEGAWYNCSSITTFLATGLDSGVNFKNTWNNCLSLTSFPALDLSAGTNFFAAWYNCPDLASFLATDLSSALDLYAAFYGCSSLTSLPSGLDISSATNFGYTWFGCTALTSFPVLDVSSGTNFEHCWQGCTSLTSFPTLTFSTDADDDINFTSAWHDCTQLESFPALNLSRGTNFTSAWEGCTDASFTSFPAVTFSTTASDDLNFTETWKSCNQLTSFPSVNLSRGTNFYQSWLNCTALASFPSDVDLSNGTSFHSAWDNTAIVSFPALDLSSGETFSSAWYDSALTSFPSLNATKGQTFAYAWGACTALTTFPSGFFDYWSPTSVNGSCFNEAWGGCTSLTAASVENILNSIATAGVAAPSSGVDITIDYDATTGTPSVATAVGILKGLSPAWTITLNGTPQ